MPGIRTFAAKDFAFDAHMGKSIFHGAFDGKRDFADGKFRYHFLHIVFL